MKETPEKKQIITDQALFKEIFHKYFLEVPNYIRVKDDNIKVQFAGYADGVASFKIVNGEEAKAVNVKDKCLAYSRKEDTTVFSYMDFIEKDGEDVFLFRPIKMQTVGNLRKEPRKTIDSDKKKLFITNSISDFVLENSLTIAANKLDKIKDKLKDDLVKVFEEIKIHFLSDTKYDSRMKFFSEENRMPILVSNFKERPDDKYQKIYDMFIRDIHKKDRNLKIKDYLISEITVPVLYKMKIPFGYIQVNSRKPLTEKDMTIVKRLASIVEVLLDKHKVFPKSEEKILVADLSKRGIGLAFEISRRKLVRHFKENCLVYFDLPLPNGNKVNILASVRYVKIIDSKIVKVGCQIKDIDALSEVNYDEYLESIGIDPYE